MASLQLTLGKVGELVSKDGEIDVKEIRKLLLLQTKDVHKTAKKVPVTFGASTGGDFSVFGPTSAFHNAVDLSSAPTSIALFDNLLMNLSLLVSCISNFFKWQYPDVTTFIHRESFLNDFLSPKSNMGYCSEELVYAIAALGAKCSIDENIRELAISFFETARSKIMSTKICQPQINTLQALLCLSLYELGEGNASSSWMFSGMAIRMGYDLGFQMNPTDWAITDSENAPKGPNVLTNMDIMVRSRIYWGCYVVDNFVSLIMGRPVTVRKSEASVPSSEVLPNVANIEMYVFPDNGGIKNLDASKTIEPLCSLSECIGSLLSDIYSSETGDDGFAYLNMSRLEEYNNFLRQWRESLPSAMKWKKSTLQRQNYNPTVMNYKLFYFIVLICLNRPFLNSLATEARDSSENICNEATEELAICLSKFNDSRCPASILVVYSSILAISVVLMQFHATSAESFSRAKLDELKVFYETISRSCASWKLASKSLMFIKKKVAEIEHPEVTSLFDSAEEMFQSTLTRSEVEQLVELSEDIASWGYQDNLFTNFFDFLEHP